MSKSKSTVTKTEKREIKEQINRSIADFVAVNMEEDDYVSIIRTLAEVELHAYDVSREVAKQVAKKLTAIFGFPVDSKYPRMHLMPQRF